jgi:hypothetical protein
MDITITSTVRYTPTTTSTEHRTITYGVPADFLPIRSTLPEYSQLQKRAAPAAAVPSSNCIATTTTTQTISLCSTLIIAASQNSSPPSPHSSRASSIRPITTTIFQTLTLPTSTYTTTVTSTSFPGCDDGRNYLINHAITSPGTQPDLIALTAPLIINAESDGDLFTRCCKAAFRLGKVAFWQLGQTDYSCRVWRVADAGSEDGRICPSQAERKFNLTLTSARSGEALAQVKGNGPCGRVTGFV